MIAGAPRAPHPRVIPCNSSAAPQYSVFSSAYTTISVDPPKLRSIHRFFSIAHVLSITPIAMSADLTILYLID
jgi:hypothetical protein